jgi:hypothetical protein
MTTIETNNKPQAFVAVMRARKPLTKEEVTGFHILVTNGGEKHAKFGTIQESLRRHPEHIDIDEPQVMELSREDLTKMLGALDGAEVS